MPANCVCVCVCEFSTVENRNAHDIGVRFDCQISKFGFGYRLYIKLTHELHKMKATRFYMLTALT